MGSHHYLRPPTMEPDRKPLNVRLLKGPSVRICVSGGCAQSWSSGCTLAEHVEIYSAEQKALETITLFQRPPPVPIAKQMPHPSGMPRQCFCGHLLPDVCRAARPPGPPGCQSTSPASLSPKSPHGRPVKNGTHFRGPLSICTNYSKKEKKAQTREA